MFVKWDGTEATDTVPRRHTLLAAVQMQCPGAVARAKRQLYASDGSLYCTRAVVIQFKELVLLGIEEAGQSSMLHAPQWVQTSCTGTCTRVVTPQLVYHNLQQGASQR